VFLNHIAKLSKVKNLNFSYKFVLRRERIRNSRAKKLQITNLQQQMEDCKSKIGEAN
jgi:hypothetical protein